MLIEWEYWDLNELEGYTNGESIIDKDCWLKAYNLCGIFPLSATKEAG